MWADCGGIHAAQFAVEVPPADLVEAAIEFGDEIVHDGGATAHSPLIMLAATSPRCWHCVFAGIGCFAVERDGDEVGECVRPEFAYLAGHAERASAVDGGHAENFLGRKVG